MLGVGEVDARRPEDVEWVPAAESERLVVVRGRSSPSSRMRSTTATALEIPVAYWET
jgi:hypothetical protein